jgi:blue copper oxidase
LPRHLAEIETLRTDLPARNFTLQTTDKMNKGPVPGEDGRQRPNTAPGPGGMSLGVGGEDWFSINHQYMNPARINAALKLGSTEIWQFENRSEMAHPMHYHGVSFQIVSVNGKPPAPEMAGWKDTVLVRHNETVRTIAQFTQPASQAYPFMLHCHILEHEDNGMMNQFTVS